MVLAALSFLAAARLQTPVAELDFEMVGGRIYVPGEVNGHKTSVILDSGAGSAVMDLELANDWKLASAGQVPVGGIGKDPVMGKLLTDANANVAGLKTGVQIAIPLDSLAKAEGRR